MTEIRDPAPASMGARHLAGPRAPAAIYEHMVDGILIVDAQGVIVCANPAARGCSPVAVTETLEGEVFGFPIADRNAVVIDLSPTAHGVRVAEMRVAAIEWRGEPAHLLSLRDITEQTTLLGQLERAANFDFVTGLPNRRSSPRLEQACGSPGATGTDRAALHRPRRLQEHQRRARARHRGRVPRRRSGSGSRPSSARRTASLAWRATSSPSCSPAQAPAGGRGRREQDRGEPRAAVRGRRSVDPLEPASASRCSRRTRTGDDLIRRADIAMYEAKKLGKGMYRFYSNGKCPTTMR
jgi:hypothetical protein